MESTILFLILALLAEVLGTIGGFGSSLFFIPIASYFFDFHTVLGITALFHVTSNITKIAIFKSGFDTKLILTIGVPAVLFVILGAFCSKYLNTALLETALAIFLIGSSLVLLLFKNLTIQPTQLNGILGGTLSGFIAGVVGTGGAIRGMVLASYDLKIDVFIATSAIIDLAIDLSRSAVYIWNGFVHQHDLYLVPLLVIVSIAGTYIGKWVLTKVSEQQFKSIVLILVLITGIISLLKIMYRLT